MKESGFRITFGFRAIGVGSADRAEMIAIIGIGIAFVLIAVAGLWTLF